jgi:predicted DNA repair protein MutK
MVITLAAVPDAGILMRALVLGLVGIGITVAVYASSREAAATFAIAATSSRRARSPMLKGSLLSLPKRVPVGEAILFAR